MKKLLLVFLSLFVLSALFSCGEKEAFDNEIKHPVTDEFECEFDDQNKHITIIGYAGNETEIIIPEKFGDYTVVAVGKGVFSEKYDVEKIEIPSSVVLLDNSCFELCISLREIALPEKLEKIGNTVFKQCRSLESISIPASVKEIGVAAFNGCDSLSKITVDDECEFFSSDKYGALLDKDQTRIIQYPIGSTRTKYEMPSTVKSVDGYAFQDAKKLESVGFSSSLESLGSYAFNGSSIKKVDLSGTQIKDIGAFCFNQTKISDLVLGEMLEKIGSSAFGWCDAISEINIPASVKYIGNTAFYLCSSVTKYVVDEKNTEYSSDENGVLYNKDKTVLIQYPAMSDNREFRIPVGVQRIISSAFVSSMNLESVIVCDSVNEIESQAFYWCSNLEKVTFEGTPPEVIGNDAFKDTKIK